MTTRILCAFLTLAMALGLVPNSPGQRPLRVGAKNFTESGVLAELLAQQVEAQTDLTVERRLGLSGTKVCWGALVEGELDFYVDYTGTLWAEVLQRTEGITDPLKTFALVQQELRDRYDVEVLPPLGFDNTYRIIVRKELAERLSLRTTSDLLAHDGELRAGFSIEFMDRADGWPGLQRVYGLGFASTRGLEHGLAYEALVAGELDVMDAYATDGKLQRFAVRALVDDRQLFPPYQAVPLVRGETLRNHPELRKALAGFTYRITPERMQRVNLMVEEGRADFAGGARALRSEGAPDAAEQRGPDRRSLWFQLFRPLTLSLLLQHVALTLAAVLVAGLIALPLGVLCARRPGLAQLSLQTAGVIQTIPSLALLALAVAIPGLGLSWTTALLALTLYGVLPILRNTVTGIREVDHKLVEAGRGLGLTDRQILREIELPLAIPTIMAGLRTATVVSVGVATLAAFIGAGGLGEHITKGLYLNNTGMLLAGAIPAALLALAADSALGWIEARVAPSLAGSSRGTVQRP